MTEKEIISILFAVTTFIVVVRVGRDLKKMLSNAHREREDIHRRLDKVSERIKRFDGGEPEK